LRQAEGISKKNVIELKRRGAVMSEIQLEDGTINVDGEWLSIEDLTQRIQEKMQSGDMKLKNLATALEELNSALENSHTIEVKLVITNKDYKKLTAFGGEDDRESVRKAILKYIGAEAQHAGAVQEKMVIKCPQCMTPIEVTTDERPVVVECQHCGTSGRLTAQNRWAKLDQD
jgi:hypothetical protein